MVYHLIGFVAGFILDFFIGDPYWLPHPVRFIGGAISFFEKKLIGSKTNPKLLSVNQKRFRGKLIVLLVILSTEIPVCLILFLAWILSKKIHPVIFVCVEAVMTFQILAAKSLKDESMMVYNKLVQQDLEGARKAVSMIVGRDTENLSAEEITKAAVETVAENTSDGVTSPMFYLALGGPILGFLYKAVNTMDSMIGYKNERYLDFGRAAALTDDALNFIPARISSLMMIFFSGIAGKSYNAKNAWRIFKRDRLKHHSPNAGHTESVCAGALQIQLAGPAMYEGKMEQKEFLGDPIRKIEYEDIKKANVLMYGTSILFVILYSSIMFVLGC